jgi:hypothetical protein
VDVHRYGDERLARLLSLLPPAPKVWVMRAKQIFVDRVVRIAPAPTGKPLTDNELARLRRALELDPLFRRRFDADPVAAAEAAGMHEVAAGLDQELRELVALAERIARDSDLRAALDTDPVAALAAAGFPDAATESLLSVLDVQGEAQAMLPEVVAHHHQQPPSRGQVLIILLGSTAVTDQIQSALRNT